MSADYYSCVVTVEKKIHVTLPLSYAGNQTLGVKDVLENWKCSYIQELDGVVVDYKNLSFVNPFGRILADQACVHYDVKAEFSVFRPTVGSKLKGVVNRISREHVGCVVHDSINVSIYLPESITSKVTSCITIDCCILFEVTNVEIHRKVIRVKGIMTPECLELMKGLFPNQSKKGHLFFDSDNEDNSSVSTEREQFEGNSGLLHQAGTSQAGILEQLTVSPTKHKKKKRKLNEDSIGVETSSSNSFNFIPLSVLSMGTSASEYHNEGNSSETISLVQSSNPRTSSEIPSSVAKITENPKKRKRSHSGSDVAVVNLLESTRSEHSFVNDVNHEPKVNSVKKVANKPKVGVKVKTKRKNEVMLEKTRKKSKDGKKKDKVKSGKNKDKVKSGKKKDKVRSGKIKDKVRAEKIKDKKKKKEKHRSKSLKGDKNKIKKPKKSKTKSSDNV